MGYKSDAIRNLVLSGHGGTGKTSLLEHLLFAAGAIGKAETVDSGKTVSDYTEEEVSHKFSVRASLSHAEWKGRKINFVDTPGSSDFFGEVIVGFRSCELALVAVDAKSGVQIETIKHWRNLDERGKPRIVCVTKIDEERADFARALEDVAAKLKAHPVPAVIPMGANASFKGVIDAISGKAYLAPGADAKEAPSDVPAEFQGALTEARQALMEAAADGSEELMEKYLDKGELSEEDMRRGLALALAANKVVLACCVSALRGSGMTALLDLVAEIGPSPVGAKEYGVDAEGEEFEVLVDPAAPLLAMVIKTQIDQFSGRLSYMKVFQGTLAADSEATHVLENKKEKVFKLYTAQGKKLEEVKELCAGDIGIAAKIQALRTNCVLSLHDKPFSLRKLRLPHPVHALAYSTNSKKDEDKLAELLLKACEEDLTFTMAFNAETHENVISGMGEQQINMILDKVKKAQHIEINTKVPRIAYRETITKKASAEHTHKKQTGGHGQYARCVLDIEPLPRGKKYEFVNAVFGGAISKGFIPAIDKGVHEALVHGTLAGYPVVDVKVTVVDGKEHAVDSSELAFKLAARGAFRDAMAAAGPVLLEPVMKLTVFVESQYLGDVMSDLSGRRGKILGENPLAGGIEEIKAQVPQAELLRYSIDLRSFTSGTGGFEVEFDHYSPISGKIADEVIKEAQSFRTEIAEE